MYFVMQMGKGFAVVKCWFFRIFASIGGDDNGEEITETPEDAQEDTNNNGDDEEIEEVEEFEAFEEVEEEVAGEAD